MESSDTPTILITGAGIGIGAATARAFADAGCRVIVTDVLEEEGQIGRQRHRIRAAARPSTDTLTSRTQKRLTPWCPAFRTGTVRCTR